MLFRPNRVPAFALVAIIGWCAAARAQQPAPATPPPTDTSAPAPATAPPSDQTQPNPPPPQLQPDQTQPQPPEAAPQPAKPVFYAKDAKGKPVYIGPKDPIELPPTPVLDEEGRQRLDLDGQPMFNKPVFQLRDKKGHPVFDDQGKPVFQTPKDLGYTAEGKKIDAVKEKPLKTIAVPHHPRHPDGRWTDRQGAAQLRHQRLEIHLLLCPLDRHHGRFKRAVSRLKGTKRCLRRQDPDRHGRRSHLAALLRRAPARQEAAARLRPARPRLQAPHPVSRHGLRPPIERAFRVARRKAEPGHRRHRPGSTAAGKSASGPAALRLSAGPDAHARPQTAARPDRPGPTLRPH